MRDIEQAIREINGTMAIEGMPLTEEDKALALEVHSIMVTGGVFPLPRGIRLGDGLEQVKEAYPDPPYRGQVWDNGIANLFYRYGGEVEREYGVLYNFEQNSLVSVHIEWVYA